IKPIETMKTIGFILFPQLTQLDLTGPYEVFARLPDTQVFLLAHTLDPIATEKGLSILPNCSFADAPQLDVICVPGGPGINACLTDDVMLNFLRQQSIQAAYVTSVCTGALILAAAGLLEGYQATTHWLSLDLLRMFGVDVRTDRVVQDRNRITGGGVTAGIDFGLALAAELFGKATAEAIQLMMEYNPQPPFDSGHPSCATEEIVKKVQAMAAPYQEERRKIVAEIAVHSSLTKRS
ncbi:MAG TPA: DJ-1/PfpI family protein, partial [Haliscomenobacter sp.]|nr:DJ-1/PfpI family protein [Haliscomenobacter sp.]